MRLSTILATVAVTLALALPAAAEIYPRPTVDDMCGSASLIVEGRYEGEGIVRLARTYARPAELPADAETIHVPGLDILRLDVGPIWEEERRTIEPSSVVLFLEPAAGGTWEPLHLIRARSDDSRTAGSAGVVWIAEGRCHGYSQSIRPGPYDLVVRTETTQLWLPADVESLRDAIAVGLRGAETWRQALALPDATERAERLAGYLAPETSPDGERTTRLYAVKEPLAACGADAVAPLQAVLRKRPPVGWLTVAVETAGLLGRAAAPLVADIAPHVTSENGGLAQAAIGALGRSGSADALPALRSCLDDERFWVVEVTAKSLARLGDRASFDRIAARLPETPQADRAGLVSDVLLHLDALDPERARPLLDRYIEMPEMRSTVRFLRSVRAGAYRPK
jgi:hypothetical protein